MNIQEATRQWSSRPADQRFLSLDEMHTRLAAIRANSAAKVLPSASLMIAPAESDHVKGLTIAGVNGIPATMTNWAFGQVAQRAGAPAAYLAKLPAPVAADCLNYGLQVMRESEDCGILLHRDPDSRALELRAATGPTYGRIWNADIVNMLRQRFGRGDGTDGGAWRVPGEFGELVPVTRENTTLYASDRDMFVFLADETNRIEVPDRRDGKSGSLARGFYIKNSDVGSASLSLGFFLFDYACKNRTIWGGQDFKAVNLRHTSGAPERWLGEMVPAIQSYAAGTAATVTQAIADARADRLNNKVDEFLRNRFGARLAEQVKAAHMADEQRPIESRWDAANGLTAFARGIEHQDKRVELETLAGDLLTG